MREEQAVSEMVEEVLSRQAQTRAEQTGEAFEEALKTVVETEAGRQLEELGSGAHQHEEACYWQANLLFERATEQARLQG